MTLVGSRKPSLRMDKVDNVRLAMDLVAEICNETSVDLDLVSDVYVEGPDWRGEAWPVINASILSDEEVWRIMQYAEGRGLAATMRRNVCGENLIDIYTVRM